MAVDVGSLQRQHPEWNIVNAISSPNGGIWAVGRDGGVFSLNAQGGTDGTVAPFFGSYTGLAPENRQGDRYFTDIQADPATGGYTLVSNRPGQTYNFVGNQPRDQPVVTSPAPAGAPAPNSDADYNQLLSALKAIGLDGLIDDAWKYYKGPGGGDAQSTLDYLPTTTAYQQRFPGLKELADQGRAWTPGQWNTYFNTAQDQANAAGLPPGFVDREDIGKLLTGGVSAGELADRIQTASNAVYKADPETIGFMRSKYGLGDGDLTAYFLDPDKATPFMERKAQLQASAIGGAAARAGYEPISGDTATGLNKLGISAAQAQQGFTSLATQHGLFANSVEEARAGESITQQEQLGAQFGGNAAAQAEIETRRARRGAAFQGGGGSASGGQGKQGIG